MLGVQKLNKYQLKHLEHLFQRLYTDFIRIAIENLVFGLLH